MRRRALLSVTLGLLLGCAEQIPDHVALLPAAEDVAIATDPPSAQNYRVIGEVTGQAAATDVEVAQAAARNDLRNKAAALGASLVTIGHDTGEGVLLQNKTKVTLVGRAYQAIE